VHGRIWSVPIAVVLSLTLAAQALATHWEPGYQNYGRGTTNACRVSGDRFTSYAYVRWTSTEANNLRATAQQYNVRYTQDMRDASDNVDADGYWTSTFPSPVFDRENDAGFPVTETKYEEAEVTATSSSFPTAGTTYYFSARYSHWWGGSGPCGPNGDNGGGYIGHNEHMSQYSFGEWNTYNFAYSGTKNFSYPYVCVVSPCVASAPAEESNEVSSTSRPPGEGRLGGRLREIQVSLSAPFRVFEDGDDVFIDPNFDRGLDEYREDIHELGRQFMSTARDAEAVLTFTQPLSDADLIELAANGIIIVAVEAIGNDGSGARFSAGAPYTDDVWASLTEFAQETVVGSTLQGVVAVDVVMPDRTALDAAVADPRVFSVDLSAAVVKQMAGLSETPKVNDLYWFVAGWDPVE